MGATEVVPGAANISTMLTNASTVLTSLSLSWSQHAREVGKTRLQEREAKEALVKVLGISHFDGSLQDLLIAVKKKQDADEKKRRTAGVILARRRRKEHRRVDPNDGRPRTHAEFAAFYRSNKEWDAALLERRVDQNDGNEYTKEEVRVRKRGERMR